MSIKSGMQTLRTETRAPEPRKCKQDFVDFGNRGHFMILVHLFHFTDKETVAERIHHHTSSACSQHKHILHSKLLTELNKNPSILTLYSGLFGLHSWFHYTFYFGDLENLSLNYKCLHMKNILLESDTRRT